MTDLVRDTLESDTKRNQALTPEMKVIITLRYLATGKMQQCSGDDMGVSQATVSRVIAQTLAMLCQAWTYAIASSPSLTPWMLWRGRRLTMNIAHFPGVIGVIDCTHVRIVAPKQEKDTIASMFR